MSNAQAANALSNASPYASNWSALAGSRYGGTGNAPSSSAVGRAESLLAAVAGQTQVSGTDSTPVTLSGAGLALSANDGTSTTGSSDFGQEASYLGGLANASLAALGIITPDQEAGTQITFDSLSYNVSSSASAGVAQSGGQTLAAYGSSQEAQFIGQGEITTADGQTYDFQIEVDMGQSEQVQESGSGDASTSGISLPWSTNSSSPTPDASPASGAASGIGSSGLINWNAILDQSKSLLELLDSMGQATQATNDAANSAANSAVSSSVAGATPSSASSPAAPSSSAAAATPAAQAA